MVKRFLLCFLLFLAIAVIAGPACNREGSMTTDLRTDSGKKLWEDITDDETYSAWKLWPGTQKFFMAAPPHGPLSTIYVNDEAFQAIEDRAKGMPKDAIIVMENWTDGMSLASVTVMKKVPGLYPSRGDWLWAQYNAHGDAVQVGMLEECTACHAQNATNDYLMHAVLAGK